MSVVSDPRRIFGNGIYLIHPGLYITDYQPELIKAAAWFDISLAVDLTGNCRPKPYPIGAHLILISYPIDDGDYLTPDQILDLRLLSDIAIRKMSENKKVLIQCHAGLNRSGLLAGMILENLLKISGDKAIQMVRQGRERDDALSNPYFRKILRGY